MNINKVSNAFEQKNERLPAYHELREETGLSVEKIADCNLNSQKTYFLDMVMNEETGYTLLDTVADENSPGTDASLMLESFNIDLDKTLKELPFRQEMILKMFFGIR